MTGHALACRCFDRELVQHSMIVGKETHPPLGPEITSEKVFEFIRKTARCFSCFSRLIAVDPA